MLRGRRAHRLLNRLRRRFRHKRADISGPRPVAAQHRRSAQWYRSLIDAYRREDTQCVRSILALARGKRAGTGSHDDSDPSVDLTDPRHIRRLRKMIDKLPVNDPNHERYRRFMRFLIYERIGYRLSSLDDDISGIQKAGYIETSGLRLTYDQVWPALAHERSHDRREAIWEAYLEFVEQRLNPILADRQALWVKELRRHGLGTAEQDARDFKKVSLRRLARICGQVTERTEDAYQAGMARLVAETGDWQFPGVNQCHWERIADQPDFRPLFPARKIKQAIKNTFLGLGLDFRTQANLHVDLEHNPRKDSIPCCIALNAPEEVWLIVSPRGGQEDAASLLHEAGHAWFHALTDPDLPFEDRDLPRSQALTELYAFLFENLIFEPKWLTEMMGLDRKAARQFIRNGRTNDQFRFRRNLGKLLYEIRRCRHPTDSGLNRQAYVQTLSELTGFAFSGTRYLEDLYDDFYSADYLRAWLAVGHLEAFLKREYGKAWWTEPEAGRWLRRLWKLGVSQEMEPLMAQELGVDVSDPEPLTKSYLNI